VLRLKRPSERRPGLQRQNALVFWARFISETLTKHAAIASTTIQMIRIKNAIVRDPNAKNYTDVALTPVQDDDDTTLDLFTKTAGALDAVAHIKKVARLTSVG
jgi:hypothetical protein